MTREPSANRFASGDTVRDLPPPELGDDRLADAMRAVDQLSLEECRAFLRTLYRAVAAYEDAGDVRYLERFAAQAKTAAKLNSRETYREAIADAPTTPAGPGESLSVGEVLSKLGA